MARDAKGGVGFGKDGGMAFQKGHSAIHAINSIFHTHHGTTNAVCMPTVLALNEPAIRDPFNEASSYLGIADVFEGFCACVQRFYDQFSTSRNLTNLGAEASQIDDLITMVLDDPS